MLLRTAICAAVLLLCQPHAALAQDAARATLAEQDLAGRIDAAIAPMFQPAAPGATVIVVKDGKTVLRRAYGMSDTAKGVKMAPEMALRLGSITKQFTSTGILMLAEEGKLSVDDDITKHLPDYPTRGKKITIAQLLTHTSGIASYTAKPDYRTRMTQDLTVAQMIDSFKDDPLDFEPGSQYRYNNSGYFLLGAIIEKISGQSYASFVEQRIFVPLGMNDTYYEGHGSSKAPVAAGHMRVESGFGPAHPLSMTQPYAAGSLVSTVDDLARWDAAIRAGRLLKPASWQKAFTPYRLADGKDINYGYGWEVATVQGAPMVGHGGGINGFSTYALRLPEQKVYVAVLTNSDSGPVNPGVVARKAAGIAIGKPHREFREVALQPAALNGLAGAFEVEKGVQRVFRRQGDSLVMQRSGRPPVVVKPLSANEFFIPGTLEYFEFQRNEQGVVTQVLQHYDGGTLVQPRVGDAPAGRRAVKIADGAFDARVGRYELRPGFVMELSREGGRYFAQATGQGKLEIFPMSETVFFSNDVDAEISFEGQGFVLKQGGRNLPARKL
ncbi:serine hydrolase [Massilia yuzhufengensis]|uniref:CubicO group peptidase, beta-lactamase class C family n=1 Tax=Massilia yuzhufengensis TaxID=1164594 RepID=A0A1I1DD17_9BURK|nr:serine hydrolase [Massilia yuzhufengensis]SFB72801.1 CubicO group peptidase, beta-lactamase class C family [Massilia yuzhufengensis]